MSNITLAALLTAVVADNIVDLDEVATIREAVYADDVVDTDEVEFLFKVNDAVTGNDNAPEWTDLFVEAVTDNIMADGTIDDDEVNFLVRLIGEDGQVDGAEKLLLENLKTKNGGALPDALETMLAA